MIYHKGISGIVFIGEKHKHIDIFITCAITTFIYSLERKMYKELIVKAKAPILIVHSDSEC